MIDELKLILDSIGDIAGIGLWVVVLFILWKLVMWLATTGAIVFLVKLGIEKLSEAILLNLRNRAKPESLGEYTFNDKCIDAHTANRLTRVLQTFSDEKARLKGDLHHATYIHDIHVARIEEALKGAIELASE